RGRAPRGLRAPGPGARGCLRRRRRRRGARGPERLRYPMSDFRTLPPDLPVPVDDGAADHLPGLEVPAVKFPATTGRGIDLAEASRGPGRLVVYVYPRTGTPGQPLLPGWDDIPGARGCTPESCAFRDLLGEF